jgi:hypothetical protein
VNGSAVLQHVAYEYAPIPAVPQPKPKSHFHEISASQFADRRLFILGHVLRDRFNISASNPNQATSSRQKITSPRSRRPHPRLHEKLLTQEFDPEPNMLLVFERNFGCPYRAATTLLAVLRHVDALRFVAPAVLSHFFFLQLVSPSLPVTNE